MPADAEEQLVQLQEDGSRLKLNLTCSSNMQRTHHDESVEGQNSVKGLVCSKKEPRLNSEESRTMAN
jgi:hypothetical protein